MTVFRAHVNGYTFSTTNLNLMQMWVDARKLDCKGHTLKLHQGKRHGDCDVFAANCFSRTSVL